MAALTSDQLLDRRRLQRRVAAWRVLAFVALAVALIVAGWRLAGSSNGGSYLVPHIARLSIGGLITGDRETLKLIDDIAKSNASGVVVSIDSPGGTTAGAERLYDGLRRLSKKKPTVAVVGALAASGGYIAAIGTDYIVAEGNSLVGSIGVLFEFPNVAQALDKIGVKVETIKSSPLKAAPNGFEPTSPEAKAAIDALVVDSYDWFKGLVRSRRNLDDQGLAAIDDGRVFTGRQGIPLHLVDRLGEERDAIQYLEDKRGVAKGLKILDWKSESGLGGFRIFSLAEGIARGLSLDFLADLIEQSRHLAEARSLDGLLSIWQVR